MEGVLGRKVAAKRTPPGPRGDLLTGSLRPYKADRLRFLMDAVHTYGDVVHFRLSTKSLYLLRHPDHVGIVLQDRARNFSKMSEGYKKLKLLLGEGLFTSENPLWARQRRIAQPAFHHQRIVSLTSTMTRCAGEMLDEWHRGTATGTYLDVAAEMMRVTLRIVVQTLLGSDLREDSYREVKWGLAVAIDYMNSANYRLFGLPYLPTPRKRQFHKALDALDKIVNDIIETRRREGEARNDLLSMLMEARDEETGEGMSDRQLRDEVMTIFLAGHETTAVALTWTCYFLSTRPEIWRRVREEVRAVLQGRTPTVEDLSKLIYTTMVIRESLRVCPPLWAFSRIAKTDEVIGGYDVPANSIVLVCPYLTHRDTQFWQNPEAFDPERFTPENMHARPRYAYLPFGGGPRLCIGHSFAILELQLIISMIAQRFELRLLPGHQVAPEPKVTLRPKCGMPMLPHPLA